MMGRKKGYIFTNKEHSYAGIMSTILGALANITLGTAVYLSYVNKGETSARYGAAALLAVVFTLVGLGLAVWSSTERDKFKLFTVLGVVINILALGMLSLILYAGAYVD